MPYRDSPTPPHPMGMALPSCAGTSLRCCRIPQGLLAPKLLPVPPWGQPSPTAMAQPHRDTSPPTQVPLFPIKGEAPTMKTHSCIIASVPLCVVPGGTIGGSVPWFKEATTTTAALPLLLGGGGQGLCVSSGL